MYTLSQIRSGINALRRKYAKELAIYRLRQLAEELCDQWAAAVADKKPAPEPHTLIRRVNRGRFNCYDSMGLHHYLQRCRRENRCPQPKDFVRSLPPLGLESPLRPPVPVGTPRHGLTGKRPGAQPIPSPSKGEG